MRSLIVLSTKVNKLPFVTGGMPLRGLSFILPVCRRRIISLEMVILDTLKWSTWAHARRLCRIHTWQHILFSDESRFSLRFSDWRYRVYRRRGERFTDQCVYDCSLSYLVKSITFPHKSRRDPWFSIGSHANTS
jgi:hypothetical protein